MIIRDFCPACGARLGKQFIEGRHRLFCHSCQRPLYENPVPATAMVVLNSKGQVLLVKRKVEPKKGQWCLPGGYLELGETPEAGGLRELEEETGLTGEIDGWAGNELSESPIYKSVLVVGYRVKNISGSLQAGDDCEEVAFFKRNELPTLAFRSHARILQRAWGNPLSPQDDWGAYVITSDNHLEVAKKACSAGVKILQYRDKSSPRGELLETAQALREVTRKSNTLFIVNDFIDIALMAGADGVHLGQDDVPILEARKMTPPGFIIGLSTHSLEQALKAQDQGADYIGSGPVFATPTKEDYVPIGIDTVAEVVKRISIPVVAIGGLNLGNIGDLSARGIKNFAMVRALQQEADLAVTKIRRLLTN